MIDINRLENSIDTCGEIPFQVRLEVLKSIDRSQRENLAYQCARFVHPIWNEQFPTEHEPFLTLTRLWEKSRKAELDYSTQAHELARLQNLLDEKFDIGEGSYSPVYAGYAAWAACHVLCHDEVLDVPSAEKDSDPDDWGPAFYASCAYSGGAHWDTIPGDNLKRREYWLWYIAIVTKTPL
jgi:hypothetical protein